MGAPGVDVVAAGSSFTSVGSITPFLSDGGGTGSAFAAGAAGSTGRWAAVGVAHDASKIAIAPAAILHTRRSVIGKVT